MEKRELISFGVSTGEYGKFIEAICDRAGKGGYVCIANVHMVIEAVDDPGFAEIVNKAEIVTPDGKPLALMMSWLSGKRQPRVAGMDLLPDLLNECGKRRLKVFFYGGTAELLDKTREKVRVEFPDTHICGTLPPPFGEISDEVIENHVCRIKEEDPDLIFMVMGCPKQEKMMAKMSPGLKGVMIGIGGALPVFSGEKKRAPVWMQRFSLEWLFRLVQEPSRLWKRYLYTNTKFVFLAIGELFRRKILKKTAG